MHIVVIAGLAFSCIAGPAGSNDPAYAPSSVVNAASAQSGALAANTIVTLYGERLAYGTRALRDSDIRAGAIPTVLTGSGVRVFIRDFPASIYYASPTQVNLLVPSDLTPGPATLRLALDGRSGPCVPIVLRRAAPALFRSDRQTAIALRPDGSLTTPSQPARPGDTITLYATGLGELTPPLPPGQLARTALSIARAGDLRIWLDGIEAPASSILYAGAAPGFAGLYQINWTVPPVPAPRPAIRIAIGEDASADGVFLEATP